MAHNDASFELFHELGNPSGVGLSLITLGTMVQLQGRRSPGRRAQERVRNTPAWRRQPRGTWEIHVQREKRIVAKFLVERRAREANERAQLPFERIVEALHVASEDLPA